ncbi:MAG: hypothetical protein LUM44_02050 [Pyrinomonadaceae bacterium]|nr:hypothetical protein [Pyrinomonadaceae bacterium]
MVDGRIYDTFVGEHKTDAEWVFYQNFHLKINNAISGDWSGQKEIDDANFPQKFYGD